VVQGEIVVAVADNREDSPTRDYSILFHMHFENDPYEILIRKKHCMDLWLFPKLSSIVDFPTRLYDPKEEGRIPYDEAQVKDETEEVFSGKKVR